MTPFFSIITPVYNAERFLDKCIASVQGQIYKDFELLLVNDGSIDNSGTICDKYAKNDKRIKVFHKKNEGVSCARNIALDNATGLYVLFLDADDYLRFDALKICYETITKNKLDVLQFNLLRVNPNGAVSTKTNIKRTGTVVLSAKEYISNGQMNVCAGGSCIKREIVSDNCLKFKNEIKLAEDQLFILSCISFSNRIQLIEDELYFYTFNISSATNNSNTIDIINSLNEFKNFVKTHPECEPIINRQTTSFIIKLIINGDISFKEILAVLYTRDLKYFKQSPLSNKLFSLLSKFSFRFAYFVIKFCLHITNNRQ